MLVARVNIRPLASRKLLGQLYSNITCIRSASTVRLDPAMRGFAAALTERQPCFSMSSKDIHVLSEPIQFYQLLLVSGFYVCVAADGLFVHGSPFRTWSAVRGDEFFYRLYILAMPTSAWSVPRSCSTSSTPSQRCLR